MCVMATSTVMDAADSLLARAGDTAPLGDADLDALADGLAQVDRLMAGVVGLAGRALAESTAARITSLPLARLLEVTAGWTGGDVRMLCDAARLLRDMPGTFGRFAAGEVSWGVVRSVVVACRRLDAAGRAQIDALVGQWPAADCEADRLVDELAAAADRLRPDLANAREERAIEHSFAWSQEGFDGALALYAQLDADAAATWLEALDAAADAPQDPEADGAVPRGRQRADAMVRLAQAYLAGRDGLPEPPADDEAGARADGDDAGQPASDGDSARDGGTPVRPAAGMSRERLLAAARLAGASRPRVFAVMDARALVDDTGQAGRAWLLWRAAGGRRPISDALARAVACDAQRVPAITLDGQIIDVGDAQAEIPLRLREAVWLRDGSCRFPGCDAPVQWCDCHHLVPREHGGPTVITNLGAFCRRCHTRIHRRGWQVTLDGETGVMTFKKGRRTWVTYPRGPT